MLGWGLKLVHYFLTMGHLPRVRFRFRKRSSSVLVKMWNFPTRCALAIPRATICRT